MDTSCGLRVALLEDDDLLRERVLLPKLAQYGFDAQGFSSAGAILDFLQFNVVDIVVLDVGLPDQDGFSVARQLRARLPGLGVVMLTGRSETHDRVRGLTEGADAYLAKPVEIELLAATLHSLARRLSHQLSVSEESSPRRWHLDDAGWCLVSPSGGSVALTRSERRLCQRLLETPGEIVTRETLVGALTDNTYDFDMHRLDSMVHRLRRKVADHCGGPLPLVAVHGEGYVFSTTG